MIPLDVTKPNIARIYDYWLGGKDNFEADREAAEAIRQRRPIVADQALDNKKFLELEHPGIVDCATWRAEPAPAPRADQDSMILGAVARRP